MPSIRKDSIFGGESPSGYFAGLDQYRAGIGIDPDLPISDAVGDRMTSGVLRPSSYAKFSGANVTGNPYWFLTSPKTALVYAVLSNGRLVSYDSALGSETLIGTVSPAAGNGAAYYNNYLYIFNTTNVSRYGPLDGVAALTDSVWTGATLGSLTALVSTTYPSIRGSGTIPNHAAHVHVDNKLYFGDFKNGIGYIHFIATTKVTNEGDTNNGSTYNALDLPFGFMPTDIESFGTDLVITAIQTSNATLNQGKAALFFWDTISNSFYNQVWLPDPIATAVLNNNGTIHVFSGAVSTGSGVSNGYRISAYAGGQTVQQEYFSNVGSPPLAGAVEAWGGKIVWGTFDQIQTATPASPTYYAVVKSMGSKDQRVVSGVHGIIKATATGAAGDGIVTAVKNVQNASFSFPRFIVGWRDGSGMGIDSQSTTYGTSVFQDRLVPVGKKFTIRKIRLTFGVALAANMTITPKIFLDDGSSSSTLTVINNTNYAASERYVELYPDVSGNHNFFLELTWSGTVLCPVLLPIDYEFDVEGD